MRGYVHQKTCIRLYIEGLFIICPNQKESKRLSAEWINCGIFIQQNSIPKYKRMLYLTTWIYLINNIEQNKTKEYILYEYICRHTSFYCASLYLHFLDTGFFKFFFLQIEGLWQSHIELVYWHHFFQHICSLNVCVSHFSNFQQYFKFFVITVFFMVICDQ